jgi:hypothetical protein
VDQVPGHDGAHTRREDEPPILPPFGRDLLLELALAVASNGQGDARGELDVTPALPDLDLPDLDLPDLVAMLGLYHGVPYPHEPFPCGRISGKVDVVPP